jgi:hypothetical protein
MDIHLIAHLLISQVPFLIMFWCGHYSGRRSRDTEISALKFVAEAAKGMAINNAAVADKVIAEISKRQG